MLFERPLRSEVEKVYLFSRKVLNIFLTKFSKNDLEFAQYRL